MNFQEGQGMLCCLLLVKYVGYWRNESLHVLLHVTWKSTPVMAGGCLKRGQLVFPGAVGSYKCPSVKDPKINSRCSLMFHGCLMISGKSIFCSLSLTGSTMAACTRGEMRFSKWDLEDTECSALINSWVTEIHMYSLPWTPTVTCPGKYVIWAKKEKKKKALRWEARKSWCLQWTVCSLSSLRTSFLFCFREHLWDGQKDSRQQTVRGKMLLIC